MAGPDEHTGAEKIPRRRRIDVIASSCLCEWWSCCSSGQGSEQASDRLSISCFPAHCAESHSRFAAVKDRGRLTSAALTPRCHYRPCQDLASPLQTPMMWPPCWPPVGFKGCLLVSPTQAITTETRLSHFVHAGRVLR